MIFDEEKTGLTAKRINELLREGNPAIYAPQSKNFITLNPQCLQEGEEKIIVQRIKEILKDAGKLGG
jgi:hypothetical protein